jgi:hypothetical protein
MAADRPMNIRHDLVNKTITIPGHNFGQRWQAMPIHWQSPMGDIVVLKIKGHSIRLDQIHSGYASAKFLVLRLERTDGGDMEADQIAWFPIKADADA